MYHEDLTTFIDTLDSPPRELSELIKNKSWVVKKKGYGTPELEMKFLHKMFLRIKSKHPEFQSFSWEQYNAFNDEYFHFKLLSFELNKMHDVDSDISFYFLHSEYDEISSSILITSIFYPDPEEIEFAKMNNLPFDEEGLHKENWTSFWEYRNEKYKHLEIPCIKFLVLLKILEINFSLYYFLYTFGNGVRVLFNEEGVTVTQLEEGQYEGKPLGEGMDLDDM